MLICTVDKSGELSGVRSEFPFITGQDITAVCGVIGPEVEANWIQKELEQYGMFEIILSKTKEVAIESLVSMNNTEAAARVWADRYFM